MMKKNPAKTIDEYLADVRDEDHRKALEKLRKQIRAAAPRAEECISYQIPAFRQNGMLLIYLDENALSEDERQKCYGESIELTHQLRSNGKYIGANPLHPTATATSVRVRDGRRLVTDGPFAETREQLGGYFLVDAKDLDEAISIAERIPMARSGTVEVRPVVELPGLPQ